jgi:hypothetical protein
MLFVLSLIPGIACQFKDSGEPTIDEIIRVWKEQKKIRPIKVVSTTVMRENSALVKKSQRTLIVSSYGFLDIDESSDGSGRVRGKNDQYFFQLDKLPSSKVWSISSVSQLPMTQNFEAQFELIILPDIEEGIRMQRMSLPQYFEHPAVRVLNIEMDKANNDRIGIHFEIDSSKSTGPFPRGDGGLIWLSKSNQYSVDSIYWRSGKVVSHVKYEWNNHDFSSTLPNRVTVSDPNSGFRLEVGNKLQFEEISPDELRLAAFGLEEPPFARSGFWTIQRLTYGAFFLVIVVALFYWKGRQ